MVKISAPVDTGFFKYKFKLIGKVNVKNVLYMIKYSSRHSNSKFMS